MDMETCGELADWLASQPRDRRVVLQKDSEGNGYSPLAAADEGLYEPEDEQVYPAPEDKAELVASGEWSQAAADASYEPDERVIVLAPAN